MGAVAVYGATGYTGRGIVGELIERGRRVVAVGRSRARLEAVAAAATARAAGPHEVEVRTAPLDDAEALRAAFADVAAVVNAAGPFSRTTRPVVDAAIGVGAHYLDVGAEHAPLRWVFDGAGDRARAAGVALLPATAFYATLPDLLIAELTRDGGKYESVATAYDISDWRPSGAGLENRFEGLTADLFAYENGEWRTAPPARSTGWFDFPEPIGRARVVPFPAPEILTTPRHVQTRSVQSYFTTATLTPGPLGRFLPLMARASAAMIRTRARPLVERGLAAVWRSNRTGRDESDPTRFVIAVRMRGPQGERRASVSGPGIFDITMPVMAEALDRVLDPGFDRSGAIASAEVLEPRPFLDSLRPYGVSYSL